MSWPCCAVAAVRQPDCHSADQSQTHAGVLAIANADSCCWFLDREAVGYQASLNFTIAYVLTTLAAFVSSCAQPQRLRAHEIATSRASARDPMLAALMLVIMFSTAGCRLSSFLAKLWIIQAAADQSSRLAGYLCRADLRHRRVLLPARSLVHVL